MSTQPTSGALSAAEKLARNGRNCIGGIEETAVLIDREAVKPATAELLASLKEMLSYAEHSTQGQSAIKTESRGRSLTKSQADFLNDAITARAIIAKHEGRT